MSDDDPELFDSESLDAAVENIVIQHIRGPAAAAAELARVLVHGGCVALSTRDAPDRSPCFAVLLGAVGDARAPEPSEVPSGPSFFQCAEDTAFSGLLREAGLEDLRDSHIALELHVRSAAAGRRAG